MGAPRGAPTFLLVWSTAEAKGRRARVVAPVEEVRPASAEQSRPPFWRNLTVVKWVSQVAFLVVLRLAVPYCLLPRRSITSKQRDLPFSWDFLGQPFGVKLGEGFNTDPASRSGSAGRRHGQHAADHLLGNRRRHDFLGPSLASPGCRTTGSSRRSPTSTSRPSAISLSLSRSSSGCS